VIGSAATRTEHQHDPSIRITLGFCCFQDRIRNVATMVLRHHLADRRVGPATDEPIAADTAYLYDGYGWSPTMTSRTATRSRWSSRFTGRRIPSAVEISVDRTRVLDRTRQKLMTHHRVARLDATLTAMEKDLHAAL
jgi:hypothetical protein